jgi:hypothetical protein
MTDVLPLFATVALWYVLAGMGVTAYLATRAEVILPLQGIPAMRAAVEEELAKRPETPAHVRVVIRIGLAFLWLGLAFRLLMVVLTWPWHVHAFFGDE